MRILQSDLQLLSVFIQRAQEVLGEAAWNQHVYSLKYTARKTRSDCLYSTGEWGTHPARLWWRTNWWCPRSGSCWSLCTGCSVSSWWTWSPVTEVTDFYTGPFKYFCFNWTDCASYEQIVNIQRIKVRINGSVRSGFWQNIASRVGSPDK